MSGGAGPFPPPQPWLHSVRAALEREPAVVRIVLAAVRGSAPREAGACMLVGRHAVEGTIGGGRLEWDAMAAARRLLEDARGSAVMQRLVLGADLGQCCGGVVDIWLERYTGADREMLEAAASLAGRGEARLESTLTASGVERRLLRGRAAHPTPPVTVSRRAGGRVSFTEPLNDARPSVWLFGAGHVGRALVRILSDLPLQLTWIDPRTDAFPVPAPAGVQLRGEADPAALVPQAPAGTRFIIMTHSHPLDLALCRAVLARDDFAWAGLIGSASKAARFRARLRQSGIAAAAVARLVCPIGIGGIDSKWPAAIAVAVAAQLLRELGPAELRPTGGVGRPADEREPVLAAPCEAGACASCGVRL